MRDDVLEQLDGCLVMSFAANWMIKGEENRKSRQKKGSNCVNYILLHATKRHR